MKQKIYILDRACVFAEDGEIFAWVARWFLEQSENVTVFIDKFLDDVEFPSEMKCEVFSINEDFDGAIVVCYPDSFPSWLQTNKRIHPHDFFYLSAKEASVELGIAYSTARRHLSEGAFPNANPPKDWRIPLKDIHAYKKAPQTKRGRPREQK